MFSHVGTFRLPLLLILLCRSAEALIGTNCSLTVNGAVGANLSVASSCVTTSVWVQPNIILQSGSPMPSGLGISKTSNTAGIPQTATWRVFGSPSSPGVGTGVYEFSDPNAGTVMMTVNFSIIAAVVPVATSSPATVTRPYSATVSASGGTGAGFSFAVSSGSLPGGLTLSSGGLISGNPSAAGSFSFTIQATDSGANTGSVSTSIAVNPAVTMAATALIQRSVGQGFNATYIAAGGSAPITYSVLSGSLPPGAALNSASGAISGSANSVSSGSFQVQAADANGSVSSTTVSYSVVAAPALSVATPAATVGTAYSQLIQFTGAITTATVASGTMPPGLNLVGGTTISGTPTTSGTYNFTLSATDTNGVTATHVASIVVSSSVSITTLTIPNATVNISYATSIAASGGSGTGFSFSLASGTLPAGLSLASNGQISGTAVTTSVSSFTILATDSAGNTGSRLLSLQVDSPLLINTLSHAAALLGSPYSSATTANGGSGAGYAFTLSAGTLPDGLTLSSGGLISGTPTVAGISNFTIIVGDSLGNSGSRAFSLQVNSLPMISNTSFPGALLGSAYASVATASGGSGVGYSFALSAGALPVGLNLSSSGLISGTPTVAGTSNFTITVGDSLGNTGLRAFSLKVASPLVILSSTSLSPSTVGVPISITFSASGGVGALSWSESGPMLAGLSFTNGILSGVPIVAGSNSFTIIVTDSLGSTASALVTQSIREAPSITTQTLGGPFTRTGTIRIALESTGGVLPYQWKVTNGTLPPGLYLNPASGLLYGTLNGTGSTPFTITLTDSIGASTFRKYLMVVSEGPVFFTPSLLPAATLNSPYQVDIDVRSILPITELQLGSGPASLPRGLTLSSQTIQGTPTVAGSYLFEIAASDQQGSSAAQSFTLVVNPALRYSDATILPTLIRGAAFAWSPTLLGGSPPFRFQVLSGDLPPGIQLNPTTGRFGGQATLLGRFGFTLGVLDANGSNTSRMFSAEVIDSLIIRHGEIPGVLSPGKSYRWPIQVEGGTAPYTFSFPGVNPPQGMRIDGSHLEWQPTQIGSIQVELQATDSVGAKASTRLLFVVSDGILARPSFLEFRVLRGGQASQRQQLKLSAKPVNTLIRISSSANWLRFSSTTSRSPGVVEVWADPSLLPRGKSNAELILVAGETVRIQVTVEVLERTTGQLAVSSTVSPMGTHLIWIQASTDRTKFGVSLEGDAATEFRLSAKSGELDALESQLVLVEPVSIRPAASLSPLEVIVRNQTTGEAHRMILRLDQASLVQLSNRLVQLQAEAAAVESGSETIQLSGTPGGKTLVALPHDNWLVADPPSFKLDSKQSLRLFAKSGELPAGIHQTKLDLMDANGEIHASIEIELDVLEQALPIEISNRSLTLNRSLMHQSFRMRNLGRENRSYVALASSSLLHVHPEQGTIPAGSEVELEISAPVNAFPSWTRHHLAIEFSDGQMEILELDLGLTPTNGICPSNSPVLSFLSPPAGYELPPGIPHSVQVVVRNPCGTVMLGTALAINSEGQGLVALWPTADGSWRGSWTPQVASSTSSIEAIWIDSERQQGVSRSWSGRVRPNP